MVCTSSACGTHGAREEGVSLAMLWVARCRRLEQRLAYCSQSPQTSISARCTEGA